MDISIDELQEKLQRLLALLKNRKPEISSWHQILNNQQISKLLLDLKATLEDAIPSESEPTVTYTPRRF